MRNALIPILAVIGVTFAWSLGNAILIEAVFSRPGVGSTMLKAILARDYQLVQAGVLVLATGVVLINAMLDMLYGVIDPRLRTCDDARIIPDPYADTDAGRAWRPRIGAACAAAHLRHPGLAIGTFILALL